MYSVTVKDHMMVAHSLPDPYFGDAQQLHGATYIVEAEFSSSMLNSHNVVVDIGEASEAVKKVIHQLTFKNLDEYKPFDGQLTTTEFLAKHVHDTLRETFEEPLKIKITLHESHIASASYSG